MLSGNRESGGPARRKTQLEDTTNRRHEGTAREVPAAIAVAAGRPLEVTTVQLEGPREGEVLVEIKATGVCHTDEFTLSGADPEGLFPATPRPEAAGIVVDIGPGGP